MHSTLKKKAQVIVFSDWLLKSSAQQILGGQWCSEDRWEGYREERNLCISISSSRSVFKCYPSTYPLHPVFSISHTMPLQLALSFPAPLLSWHSAQQTYCGLPCFCSAPSIEISTCILSPWLSTVLIAVLRIQLCLVPRKRLTGTLWTIQPHCMCRPTITSLFSPFHGYSCPLVSIEIRSRTSCRHQSSWMLKLLT